MDGILNVAKPGGMTSFRIVAAVRRLSGEKRVGHAGTLDPMARGVLPVCIGKATRFIEFFAGFTKRYLAEVEFGVETDTYDITGQVLRRADPSGIDLKTLEAALSAFRGIIQQTPPMYSALKCKGEPLYKLARAGVSVERKPRSASIESLELTEWNPPVAMLDIVCGKGTYIRSISHDLGKALGCGAAMRSLVRTRYGPFELDNAVSLEKLATKFTEDRWGRELFPPDFVLTDLPRAVLDEDAERQMKTGRSLDAAAIGKIPANEALLEASAVSLCRAYALDGRFIGMLRFNAGIGDWKPEKVLLNS